jgi:hypothetical protein
MKLGLAGGVEQQGDDLRDAAGETFTLWDVGFDLPTTALVVGSSTRTRCPPRPRVDAGSFGGGSVVTPGEAL